MSAKRKDSGLLPQTASPADSGGFSTTEKDWNFRPIVNIFANVRREAPRGKKESVLHDPSGRIITAATFYEYARESTQLRKLCREWMDYDARLTLRNGKGWRRRLAQEQWKDARKARLPNDPAPWFPEQLADDGREFNSDYLAHEDIEAKISQYGDTIGSGSLISQLRVHLAGGSAWTDLPEAVRNQSIEAAWNDPISEAPHWPSEIETEEERARAGRDVRKGERPFLALPCRPEMPEAVYEVAESDRQREEEEGRRFANARRTPAADQRRADAIEAAWMHNEPDPRLPSAKRRK